MNTFGYVYSNPLYWIDPHGLDVNVSYNPNAAGGFGHVGVGVNTTNTVGQRPQPGASRIQTGLGMDVPGEISADPPTSSNVTIPTTKEQDKQVQQCIDKRTGQGQNYNLYSNNCTQFVQQCLGEAGIDNLKTVFPRKLYDYLQQSYGGNLP